MLTTVVFDLDDTLYDEVDYCNSGFAAVARFLATKSDTAGTDQILQQLQRQFEQGNRTHTFNAVLDQLRIPYDDKLIRQLVHLYRNHHPNITLPPSSRRVLEQLRRRYKLALLTDGFLPAQQLKVKALDIEHYFDCIVYTEQLGRQFWKPSPAGFEKILATLHQPPQTMAYVADNTEKDFIAPNRLGFHTIQLLRPARIPRAPNPDPEAQPQHIIHQIDQLPPLLETL